MIHSEQASGVFECENADNGPGNSFPRMSSVWMSGSGPIGYLSEFP